MSVVGRVRLNGFFYFPFSPAINEVRNLRIIHATGVAIIEIHRCVFINLCKVELLHQPHYYGIAAFKSQNAFFRNAIHFRKNPMWRRCMVNRCMNYDIVEMIVREGELFRIFTLHLDGAKSLAARRVSKFEIVTL